MNASFTRTSYFRSDNRLKASLQDKSELKQGHVGEMYKIFGSVTSEDTLYGVGKVSLPLIHEYEDEYDDTYDSQAMGSGEPDATTIMGK